MIEPAVPYVGPESDEYRAVCAYSPAPGQPTCDAPATVHVLVDDHAQYGEVGLASCDLHALTARRSGAFVMEHPYEGFCGFPATAWHKPQNVCVLDDTGEEPSLREAAPREMEPSRG